MKGKEALVTVWRAQSTIEHTLEGQNSVEGASVPFLGQRPVPNYGALKTRERMLLSSLLPSCLYELKEKSSSSSSASGRESYSINSGRAMGSAICILLTDPKKEVLDSCIQAIQASMTISNGSSGRTWDVISVERDINDEDSFLVVAVAMDQDPAQDEGAKGELRSRKDRSSNIVGPHDNDTEKHISAAVNKGGNDKKLDLLALVGILGDLCAGLQSPQVNVSQGLPLTNMSVQERGAKVMEEDVGETLTEKENMEEANDVKASKGSALGRKERGLGQQGHGKATNTKDRTWDRRATWRAVIARGLIAGTDIDDANFPVFCCHGDAISSARNALGLLVSCTDLDQVLAVESKGLQQKEGEQSHVEILADFLSNPIVLDVDQGRDNAKYSKNMMKSSFNILPYQSGSDARVVSS